ncbi:AAA family ATPase [Bradyrhizobium sp. HKCCYLR20261]|uniref:AAA family ATPase n=1 Tax=Bradyrhizobium sp. HKCCYLR20261 TaxID=3420760 RepID=UPI003EBD7C23
MTASDDTDDFDLQFEDDAASTGAAADSSNLDEQLNELPRLLRYAWLSSEGGEHIQERLVAEINEICPGLRQTSAWVVAQSAESGLDLAGELDRRAVELDEPILRSLSDCVRLFSLSLPYTADLFDDYHRLGKALIAAFRRVSHDFNEDLRAELEEFVFGWAALPACSDLVSHHASAATSAARLGPMMVKHRIEAARLALLRQQEEEKRRVETDARASLTTDEPSPQPAPDHGVIVAPLSEPQMKNAKLLEILRPIKPIINVPLPLVTTPPLRAVRDALIFEFPYAAEVIDFVLADLVGRVTVRLNPILFVGAPGGGKSRFVRRLGELLGVNVWRTDASGVDGATFGGTHRRWSTAEPCHPLLAVAQGEIANPLILIDEIDKSATRNDYGRLWDCLLAFLEVETSARYPDPALQTNLNLSQISYLATANSLAPLPSPIRDRFRVVGFPKPTAADLDALLPAIVADLASERGLDTTWIPALDGIEHTVAARHWQGGSVRRLRRIVEAILCERDAKAVRN